MDIVIPTCGRAHRQLTLAQLMAADMDVTLVVQDHEYDDYQVYADWENVRIVRLPKNIRTIAPTRQWILHNIDSDVLCMVDDDLWFYKRRDDEPTKLCDISPIELNAAFCKMHELLLQDYAHVGFAAREGANRCTDRYIRNTRIMRVLGYNTKVLKKEHICFDEMECMEDFHVALTLLERGYPNLVMNHYAHNQAGSGAEGGCSSWRTPEVQERNARRLAGYHPRFVNTVKKRTVSAWGGGERTDVRIQWKQAYEQGGRHE